jgi:hypothetical protein
VLLSLIFALFTVSAHAQKFAHFTLVEACYLRGNVELKRPTAFFCEGNFQVLDGTVITTHGNALEISSTGHLELGYKHGLQIRAVTSGVDPSGPIVIQASTAMGRLNIDNRPSSPNAYSGDINLHFTTTQDFHSSSKVGHGARVNASLNGMLVDEVDLGALK